jgi:penicillin-binding protein 2
MTRPEIYLNEVNERQGVFTRRAVLMGGVTGIGVVALSVRLADLQLVEADKYKLLAQHNEFDFRLQPAPRGLILDRTGQVLALNRPNFRLYVSREDDSTDIEELLDNLARLVPIDDAHRNRLLDDINDAPRRAPVTVMEDLTWEEFSRINVRAPELPGVTADMGDIRDYASPAFAHVVGYVSKVTKDDVPKTGPIDPILLNPGFRIGKQGLEKTFDLPMRGKPGAKKVEVDVKGRVVREDTAGDLPATPGEPLHLTLDADVQNRALEVFGAESGAAVMMDVRNGGILCLFSSPSFDANRFVKGLTAPEYRALASYDRKPLLNKATLANYPPGSTFKTMVALTALTNGVPPSRTYTCNKVWFWGGRPWHCDEAHGTLDMSGAIAHSCDIYFYQLALTQGPDKIAEVARAFGLGKKHDIGLSLTEQRPGLIPDTAYKRRAFPKDPVWHPGETPSMGIGQGYVLVNPLQLCIMCSRLANGGHALEPRLVKAVGDVEQPPSSAPVELPYSKEHLAFIREAMGQVVTAGTAAAVGKLDLGPVTWAGKTGTAQAHSYKGGVGAHGAVGAWAERDHSWFIAFAPADEPRYAMSILVEHGGFGASAAAPRAREIMRVALLKDPEIRARIVQPLPPQAPPPATPVAPDQSGATPATAPAPSNAAGDAA